MLLQPFPLLRPFEKNLRVALFLKDDDIRDDDDAARALGVPYAAGLQQMHGTRAIRIHGPSARTEQADAMATDVPGIALCLRTADCQNIVIFEPVRKVVGVLHVGWRGVEAGIITSFYELLKEEWDITPEETYVAAGPSLQMECAEFTDPTRELPSVPSTFVRGRHVDLSGAADAQLQSLGVRSERMTRMNDCTKCQSDRYWTYRGGDRAAVVSGKTNMLACVLL